MRSIKTKSSALPLIVEEEEEEEQAQFYVSNKLFVF